jgi:hypothetical protein
MSVIKKQDVKSQLPAAQARIYIRSIQEVNIPRQTRNLSRQFLRGKPTVSAD